MAHLSFGSTCTALFAIVPKPFVPRFDESLSVVSGRLISKA